MKKHISAYWRTILILLAAAAALAAVGMFPALCDLYTDHIYGHLCDGISRVTSAIPFALGEILMYIGILALALCFVFPVLLIFLRKKTGYRKFCITYLKSFLMTLVCVVLVYMPTWYIPFRGTVLGRGDEPQRTDFSYDEIDALYRYIIGGINSAAEEIEISPDGKVDLPPEEELQEMAAEAMLSMQEEYPRLAGYYPRVKPAICSDILERMSIGGYNYPYTMEPTCNKYNYPTDKPVMFAHELAHHKGYYKENEANLLGQLALIKSDDPFLRFAGFYEMYWYVSEDYYEMQEDILMQLAESGKIDIPDPFGTAEDITSYQELLLELFGEAPEISERAVMIMNASVDIGEESYDADPHPIDDLPAAQEIISDVSDNGWEIQGNILRENSYDGVVLLLLQYFDGELY